MGECGGDKARNVAAPDYLHRCISVVRRRLGLTPHYAHSQCHTPHMLEHHPCASNHRYHGSGDAAGGEEIEHGFAKYFVTYLTILISIKPMRDAIKLSHH